MRTKPVLLLAVLLLPAVAPASERRYELTPLYREECGSCHVAYPAPLLSAASWRAVMGGLGQHFGENAEIDARKSAELSAWLQARAGRADTVDAQGRPLLRISETAWFRKEHRDGHDGLTAGIWRTKAVGSPANCGACHRDAETGNYDERGIRLPR